MSRDIIKSNKMNDSNVLNNSNNNKFKNNSDNENSFNKNMSITYISEKEEKKRLEKESKEKRYGLAKHEQEMIRCRGLLLHNNKVKVLNSGKRVYTVINIVDSITGNFLSDHIQINADVVDEYIDESSREIYLIEFGGRVYNYDETRPDAYSVDVAHEKGFLEIQNTFHMVNEIEVYCGDVKVMKDYLSNLNVNELAIIIEYLRKLLNNMTKSDLGENFIYNYILNQLMFNMNNKDLCSMRLPLEHLRTNHLIDFIVLLSSTINYLTTIPESISYLFTNIALCISGIQCITRFDKSGAGFDRYVLTFETSKMKLNPNNAWAVVRQRVKNFNLQNEKPPTREQLLESASDIFNMYVPEFDKLLNM